MCKREAEDIIAVVESEAAEEEAQRNYANKIFALIQSWEGEIPKDKRYAISGGYPLDGLPEGVHNRLMTRVLHGSGSLSSATTSSLTCE